MKLNYTNNIWWNKSTNLKLLQENLNWKENFTIPQFIIFNPWDNLNELLEQIKDFKWKLAIRSDSKFEDSKDDSWAWVFETILNVWNNLEEIKKAIEIIQKDAQEKVWTQISILIMEMVENPEYAWTIFWIDSRNESPENYTINYSKWLWTNVVDWTSKTKVHIVNKNFENWNDDFIWKLIKSVKQIEKVFASSLLDIEFAYKDWKIYILQIRPLTALKEENNFEKDKFISRVLNILDKKISKKDCILGDMIDINPVELLKNTRKNFLNTLFAEIFPKWPLKEARKELWYWKSENEMQVIIFNKFYINLEENLISFLPASLDKNEKNIFINYYKNLIKNNPSLQDKLDTIEYPNNIKIVKKILNSNNLENTQKEKIIKKFDNFFENLEEKLTKYSINYLKIEKDILQDIFKVDSWKIANIDLEKLENQSIKELLKNIKKLTKLFTIFARGAFYYRNQKIDSQMKFFNFYKYSNQLKNTNKKFLIPNWFDILDNIEVKFEWKKENFDEKYIPLQKEIFELARDNLKFLFMLLLAQLWKKIEEKLKKLNINKENIYHLSFQELLENLDNFEKLKFLWEKRKIRAKKLAKIPSPSVIFWKNIPWNFETLTSWTYIWNWKIKAETYYIKDIKELYKDEILKKLKWKILFLDTATPEIDWILWKILNNVEAIVTKYWGPWAHIVLRIREENKKRKENQKQEIWLLVWLWDLFDNLKEKQGEIILDFKNEKIW